MRPHCVPPDRRTLAASGTNLTGVLGDNRAVFHLGKCKYELVRRTSEFVHLHDALAIMIPGPKLLRY